MEYLNLDDEQRFEPSEEFSRNQRLEIRKPVPNILNPELFLKNPSRFSFGGKLRLSKYKDSEKTFALYPQQSWKDFEKDIKDMLNIIDNDAPPHESNDFDSKTIKECLHMIHLFTMLFRLDVVQRFEKQGDQLLCHYSPYDLLELVKSGLLTILENYRYQQVIGLKAYMSLQKYTLRSPLSHTKETSEPYIEPALLHVKDTSGHTRNRTTITTTTDLAPHVKKHTRNDN